MEYRRRRFRGEGSIYTRPRSPYIWIKYYRAGKPIRESTRTGDLGRASRLLHQRLAAIAPAPAESPRIEQLVDDLFRDYRIKEQRSLDDVKTRWRLHLKPSLSSLSTSTLVSIAYKHLPKTYPKPGIIQGSPPFREVSSEPRAQSHRACKKSQQMDLPCVRPHEKDRDADQPCPA